MPEGNSDPFEVVAVVLTWRGRVGLFKRSELVRHDQGLWHCITGFVEPGVAPTHQAVEELHEETGLCVADLAALQQKATIRLHGGGHEWTVNTFHAETHVRRLTINWEHQAHRWVKPGQVPRYRTVAWLGDVLSAVGVGPS